MESKPIAGKSVELVPLDRIIMPILCIFSFVLYVYFQFFMAHYTFKPMPSLFQSPSLLQSPYTTPSYIYNGCLYLSFFVQHVIMSLLMYKVRLSKVWIKFPLYERYIYNTVSSILYILILRNVRPISNESDIVFTTPFWLNAPIAYVIYIFEMCTLLRLSFIIFVPYSFKDIFTSKSLQLTDYSKPSDEEFVSTGMFSIVRHPMQACTLIRFLTVSNLYTVDRLVFIAVNLTGIFVGVLFEESRLRKKFKGYTQYMKKVTYRFIPYIL